MSDVPDPQDGFESTDFEPVISGDKRIIFGARKPTEEAAPLTGIPVLIEAPFPHERTLHWWPAELPVELNGNGNTAVVVSQEVLVKVNEHVAQSLDRELGGFLLGNRYRCPNSSCDYVIIDQYSPAKYTESSEVRLNFTHDAWAQLSDELSGKFLGKLLIGWYHSHPRMDVFLSSHDMEIQTERFPEPWMVALVLEPEKHLGGFFCSRDGRVKPNLPVDFFELLERNSRDSVIGWDNYKPMDPVTNSTPAVSPPITSESIETSSPELPVIVTEVSEESPVKEKRRSRLFFAAAVVVILTGVVAVGVIKRNRIRGWLQSRGIVAAPTSQATPAPSIEQTPTPPNVAATPEASLATSPIPTPQPSPTPVETSHATANINQPAAAQSAAEETRKRNAPKRPVKPSRKRKTVK
jgi:proteasome lid subunit RPN8/RPN11